MEDVEMYSDHLLLNKRQLGPIGQYTKTTPYVVALAIAKFLHTFGLFITYEQLKVVHVVQFLFIIRVCTTCILIILQRPVSSGKKITQTQWYKIGRHAVVSTIIGLIWLEGLSLCGALRTVLLFEHSDVVVLAALGVLFHSGGTGPSKVRGSVLFLLGILCLLLFDNDSPTEGGHHSQWIHYYYGGLIILLLVLLLKVAHKNVSRTLAVEIGGGKRLAALSSFLSSVILLPLAVLSYFTQTTDVDWLDTLVPFVIVIFLVFIVDFYIESFCLSKLESASTGKIGSTASFLSAVIISMLWDQPWAWTMHEWHHGKPSDSHLVNEIVIKTIPSRDKRKSHWLYHRWLTNLQLSNAPVCVDNAAKPSTTNCGAGRIKADFLFPLSKSALVIGLCAALMARWKASRTFSYGYGRVEVLSGFVNGLFLVVISVFVFVAGLQRLYDPPTVSTERLLVVSVGGLVVNLVGIFAFSHAHSHGGSSSHGHSNHGHSHHGHGHHGHGHHGHGHCHGHGRSHADEDRHHDRSVFLHVVADTMGSVGVILSSIFIEQFGWYIADPLCSLFIASLIFISVLPLLKESSQLLLLRTPEDLERTIGIALNKVGSLVKEYGISKITVQVEKEAFFHHMSALSAGYKSVLALKQGTDLNSSSGGDFESGLIKAV
ncbi:Zinc transporter 5 [Acropora cervicornis]|uniref:Proton-coupled zinc antiporter SLC30A5 n=1 Tax=Acropora cervicornis TaxID=6130 RepID=A0AAD9QNE4_ACRCE|nr:Zinc transporter 5 [Acropora cervicornis]